MGLVSTLFKRFVLFVLLCLAIGALGSAFNVVLVKIQTVFRENSAFIWGLPFAGLMWVFIAKNFPQIPTDGTHYLLRQTATATPIKRNYFLGPSIVLSTWWSHLFGASVGRESSALQLGGAAGHLALPLWSKSLNSQKRLLLATMAAGFAAVFHTPWAAAVFIYEIAPIKSFRTLLLSIAFSHGAYTVSTNLLPHTSMQVSAFDLSWGLWLVLKLSVLGILLGLASRIFLKFHRFTSHEFQKRIGNSYYRIAFGSIIFIGLWHLFANPNLSGLSLPLISSALEGQTAFLIALQKTILTVLSVASGFKGGEVTPLFLIGAELGGSLGAYLQTPAALTAALGFVTFFAATSGSLWGCALMAAELFGPSYFLPALICIWWALKSSTRQKLYSLS